ncbi:hypothetical protein WMF31_00550 [Sorangium sp. So ce1036]|uniref:hypothetical protein n=1 Tax=Sorangium sp. So ce1036 TaxID=3133328 RepID=UPI003F0FA43C
MGENLVYIATRVALQFNPNIIWNRNTGAPLLIPHSVAQALRKKRHFGRLLDEAAQQNRATLLNPVDPVDLSRLRDKFSRISHNADWPWTPFASERDFMDPPAEAIKVVGEILAIIEMYPRSCVVVQYNDQEYYKLLNVPTCIPDNIAGPAAENHSLANALTRRNLRPFRVFAALTLLIQIPIGIISRDPQVKEPVVQALEWMAARISQRLGTPGLVVIALLSGFLFYFFRSRYRFLYGIAEVAVGVLLFCGSVPVVDGRISDLLLMTAGLYVIVRGLDNLGKWVRDTSGVSPAVYSAWVRIFGDRF